MKRKFNAEQYALVLTLVGFFCYVAYPVAKAVLIGLFLAMVLYKPYRRLVGSRKIKAGLAAGLFTVAVFVGAMLPIAYVLSSVGQDAYRVSDALTAYSTSEDPNANTLSLNTVISEIHDRIPEKLGISRDQVSSTLRTGLSKIGLGALAFLQGLAMSVPDLLLTVFFVVLSLFFGLADGRKIGTFLNELLPFPREQVAEFTETSHQIIRGVVLGSLLAGVAQGTVIAIGFVCLGVPRAFFAAILTLICSFVPVLGAAPAGIGGAIYLFATGRPVAALLMLGVLGVASSADNVVKPLALRGATELHPLIGFVAVFGGVIVFGFSGLFLGPLAAALAIVALEILRLSRKTSGPPNATPAPAVALEEALEN